MHLFLFDFLFIYLLIYLFSLFTCLFISIFFSKFFHNFSSNKTEFPFEKRFFLRKKSVCYRICEKFGIFSHLEINNLKLKTSGFKTQKTRNLRRYRSFFEINSSFSVVKDEKFQVLPETRTLNICGPVRSHIPVTPRPKFLPEPTKCT